MTFQEARQKVVRALHAVSQFRSAQYADAINAFLELNINPAKVVALYNDTVAGRLSVPEDEWIPLFGGPTTTQVSKSDSAQSLAGDDLPASISHKTEASDSDSVSVATSVPPRPPSPQGSVRGLIKTGLDTIRPSVKKDEETASVKLKRKNCMFLTLLVAYRLTVSYTVEFRKSIEELVRYLSEWRPKVAAALEALNISAARSHEMPVLSATSTEDLFALPNAPLSSLTPEQLVRFAQIVDTALFKCYLIVRPGLLAPLCRVGNWCEVSEVEEVLRAREVHAFRSLK